MNADDFFKIPFKNQVYKLPFDQVEDLLKISEYKGLDIEVIIKTNDNKEIIGTVQDFHGYNPLHPADIDIPIVFKIKTSVEIIEINFLEVKSIEVKN